MGEPQSGCEPIVSEWGNPRALIRTDPACAGRELGELKHLSTLRKRKKSRSSGERNGICLNPRRAKLAGVAAGGLRAGAGDPARSPLPAVVLHEAAGTPHQSG